MATRQLFDLECQCTSRDELRFSECEGCWKSRGIVESVSFLRPCESGHEYGPFAFIPRSGLHLDSYHNNNFGYICDRSSRLCSMLACRADLQLTLYDVFSDGVRTIQTLVNRPYTSAHSNRIAAIAMDQSGSHAFSVSCADWMVQTTTQPSDSSVKKWDLQTGACVNLDEFPAANCVCAIDDSTVLVGSRQGTLFCTGRRSGCQLYRADDKVVSVLKIDANYFITCSASRVLHLCDVRQLSNATRSCVVSTNGVFSNRARDSATELLYADGLLWLGDTRGRVALFSVDVSRVQLSRVSASVSVGLEEATGGCLSDASVSSIAAAQPKGMVVLASAGGLIKFVQPNAKGQLKVMCTLRGTKRSKTQFAAEGNALITAADNGTIRIWSRSGVREDR